VTGDRQNSAEAPLPAAPVSPDLLLLIEFLTAAIKVARRLAWSRRRVAHMMPLDAAGMRGLSDKDEERLDALLHRFNSLTTMVQDHVTRALLKAEEEDIKDRSKKDQRLLMEKLGALKPQLNFGTLAELCNRVAHHYPDDIEKQAEILNEVYVRSSDLLEGYNSVLTYVDQKLLKGNLDLRPVTSGLDADRGALGV
jgi:hypothetical protein